MATFEYLIRFESDSGEILYGEAGKPTSGEALVGSTVKVYDGTAPWDPYLRLTDKTAKVAQLLSPIPHAPIIYGVGVNYKPHATEAAQIGVKPPKFPMLFVKPSDSLAGPLEDIPIDTECQEKLDYEGELCVVIGKVCRNLNKSSEDPLDYVLGYAVGNDVSARSWQVPELSGGQHGYAKSFDKFAPIGPALVSRKVIPDPSKLHLTTRVNGDLRQETGTDDLIFGVREIIQHMCRGKTLRPGTVIMTGSPAGVGWFMNPSGLLKGGDVVEVTIDEIGSIKNKMIFEP